MQHGVERVEHNQHGVERVEHNQHGVERVEHNQDEYYLIFSIFNLKKLANSQWKRHLCT
jgi:hypothetical protein